MRYSIVTETWPPEVNGVALTVQGLARGLRERGHAVEVVRPRQPVAAGTQDDFPTVPVRSVGLPRYPGLRLGLPASGMLLRRWTEQRPDAAYVATEGPLGWSALRTARRLGIPVATGFHTRFDAYMRDYGLGLLERPARAWLRRFHNAAHATVVPTRELQDALREQGFRNVQRLARAVDTGRFDPAHRDRALRGRWGVGENGLAVIHVGRIAAEKNLALAVRAFDAVREVRPEAVLVWVGDGPERARLQREHPRFVFCGVRRGADLARHFASADLFLFPSLSETFGNVTLEALASGVPTVAFDYGAARETLRHGVHGAAIAREAAHRDRDFIAAAVRIAADDGLRRAMRPRCREAVQALRPARVAEDFDRLLLALGAENADAALAAR